MAVESDARLLGPASVSWRIHADPIMWVAGVRALYLQALHPWAMRGVAQNSDYQEDPWGRFMRTAAYVATTVYGTRGEAERAGARVRAIHDRLTAADPDTGERYRVDRPDLLLWIHCALIESFVSTAQRAGIVSQADADRYVDEQRRVAALVGLDPRDVPGSVAELDAYMAEARPELSATDEARATARFLLLPKPEKRWMRALRLCWLPVGALAFASLPPWARKLYGGPARPKPGTVTVLLRVARYLGYALPLVMRTRAEYRVARRQVRAQVADAARTARATP